MANWIKKKIDAYKGNRIMDERGCKAIKNIIVSFFIKGGSVFIAFAMVPLLIDELSPEAYGVWLTLTSFLGMFSFFNIGLGHGLKNLLIASIANKDDDNSKRLISTTYIALSAICLLVFVCFCGVNQFINWNVVLNTSDASTDDLSILALFVSGSLLLQLVLSLNINVLQAFQIPAYGDLIGVIGQFLSFIGVLIVPLYLAKADLVVYGIVISSLPSLVYLVFSIVLFRGRYLKIAPSFSHFDKCHLSKLFSMGGKFFLIQIAALLLYQSNNFIIAHISGNTDVAVYNIAYKYAGIFNMIFSLIIAPIWVAAGDAYIKNEIDWIHKIMKKMNFIWILFVMGSVLQLVLSQFVYDLWIGTSLQVSFSITALCIAYYILSMKASIYCNIINGTGKIRLQFIMYFIQVIIHVPLAIVLGKKWGIEGVLSSMCLIMLLNILWMHRQCNLLLQKKATGLWNT